MGDGGGTLVVKYSAASKAIAPRSHLCSAPSRFSTFPESERGLFPPPRRSKKQEGARNLTNQEPKIDTLVKKTAGTIKISSMQGFVDVHSTRQPD